MTPGARQYAKQIVFQEPELLRFPVVMLLYALEFRAVSQDPATTQNQSDNQPDQFDGEFGRILEDSFNEIYIFDASTLNFIQVNRGGRENLGYSMEELRALTPVDLKPEFTRESFDELVRPLRQRLQPTVRFETTHRRKDRSEYYVEVHLQLATFHNASAFIAIVLDTTDRANAASEIRMRNLAIESVGVGVVISDAVQHDHPIIFCNHAFETITGYSKQEILGHNCRFLQADDRNQEARQILRGAVQEGRECRTLLRNYRKNGELFWNELTISPVRNLENVLTHFVGVVNDVTERVIVEEAKRESEAQLRAILDTAVEAIITIDEHGVCESLNSAAERIFGYTASEVLGNNISMLMPDPYRSMHDQYLANYLQTGTKNIIGIGRDVIGLRKNGEEFPIHLAVNEVQLEHRRVFTGFVQDITQRKESERKLVQSERLAVLGEAMARLAHESRNSLQRIQIAVETARIHCEGSSPLASQLDAIEKSSDGLDALLSELKNYAAPLSLEKTQSKLAGIWREAWHSTSSLRESRTVELREEGILEELTCCVDYFRLGQVFRNLFENSLAACPDPALVTIRVSADQLPQGKVWILEYQDNGPGLNEEQASRIFEPFFTTKTKGTGLGMAIAHRIIEAHEGTISVVRTGGEGAEFLITLPQ